VKQPINIPDFSALFPGVFRYHAQTILMRHVHWSNAWTTISVGHRHTCALNNWGKTKIC